MGMSIAPVLILCFDHGLFPTLTKKASDDDGSHILGVGEKEEKAMARVVMFSTFVIVLGMLGTSLRWSLPLIIFAFLFTFFFFATIPQNKTVSTMITTKVNRVSSTQL